MNPFSPWWNRFTRQAKGAPRPRTRRNRVKPMLEPLEQRVNPNTTLSLKGTALTVSMAPGSAVNAGANADASTFTRTGQLLIED